MTKFSPYKKPRKGTKFNGTLHLGIEFKYIFSTNRDQSLRSYYEKTNFPENKRTGGRFKNLCSTLQMIFKKDLKREMTDKKLNSYTPIDK